MRLFLLLPLFLCACVSSHLAKSNLDSVTALGSVAVQHDAQLEPEATAAVDNASAIVDASAPLTQLTHLGIPSDLVDKNSAHVETLATAVAPLDTPVVRFRVKAARDNAAELQGKVAQQGSIRAAVKGLPYVDDIMMILTSVGSLIGVAYGATRGRKHVVEWWNTPSKKKVAPVPAPGDIA